MCIFYSFARYCCAVSMCDAPPPPNVLAASLPAHVDLAQSRSWCASVGAASLGDRRRQLPAAYASTHGSRTSTSPVAASSRHQVLFKRLRSTDVLLPALAV